MPRRGYCGGLTAWRWKNGAADQRGEQGEGGDSLQGDPLTL
jgi:hypothetical protein